MKISKTFVFLFTLFWIQNIDVNAQQPVLGAAESFAVFTGVGAFTITGASVVNGNAGTDEGIFTGFPPGTLFGQLHVDDVTSAQAAIDINALYLDLAGRTCGTTIGVGMGNGQTLTPGIYCTGAAATLSGNLTLDGLGDANALFIIQINGAFAANNNSVVTLINNANACNVFWQINGMLTMHPDTGFKGTCVVQGAASLLGNAAVEGRILVTSGAINMEVNTVAICDLMLPVELTGFDLSVYEKSIFINWQTSSEWNNSHFVIEKSSLGLVFNDLAKITACGTIHSTTNYSHLDPEPLVGVNYYRLKQVDADGQYSYSDVKTIIFDPVSVLIQVFPNPVVSNLNIHVSSDSEITDYIFELYFTDGRMLKSVRFFTPKAEIKNVDIQPGQYFYIVRNSITVLKKGSIQFF
jgi:hypothetical protein